MITKTIRILVGSALALIFTAGSVGSATSAPALTPIFSDSFETGDTSGWDGVNLGLGDLTITGVCALEASYGMCLTSTNNHRKQVIDNTPAAESRYFASFRLDPNNITLSGSTNRFRVFQGRNAEHFPFLLLLRYNNGMYQLRLRLQTDEGVTFYTDSEWYTISNTWHLIGVDWIRSSSPIAYNGFGDLYVDNVLQGSVHTLSGIDNDTLTIEGIRWGISQKMDGVVWTGTLYLDFFYSDNDGYE